MQLKGKWQLLLNLILLSCSITKQSTTTMFDKQGHRGCRGIMPENTIPAMLTAVDLGVTTLEMDAVITKDNKVVVSHEPFFNHEITTKPDGSYVNENEEKSLNIYHMTYDEVKLYDVGLKPHPRFPQQQKIAVAKPLLSDLMDSVEQHTEAKHLTPVYYNIETKTTITTDGLYHPAPQAFVDLLMQVILKKGIQDRVIIQSFDFRTLQYLHQHYPQMKTAMLIDEDDKRNLKELLNQLGFIPTVYSPAYQLVNDAIIKKCHQQHIKVLPWTVNTKEDINKLKAMGVDGIISDYPNLFD